MNTCAHTACRTTAPCLYGREHASTVRLVEYVPDYPGVWGLIPCEVDDCDHPASACRCGAGHCAAHPHAA